MTPRLELRLDGVEHNARTLVARLGARGIAVSGITKAAMGAPEVARTMLRAGVTSLGDSRIENLERLRRAGVTAPLVLIRAPMPSQARRVVEHADRSLNTELDVIARLSMAAQAQQRRHGVVLMVELGDLREGILPSRLDAVVRRTLRFPGIDLVGLGANLACQSGVAPDAENMAELTRLAASASARFGAPLPVLSGGNSASLGWALGAADVGRVNELRLGESILLGLDPLDRRPVPGLRTDTVALVAEVIEVQVKPTRPWGTRHQTAFGAAPPDHEEARVDAGTHAGAMAPRVILAIGHQDLDPDDVTPPEGMAVLGASSDHLVIDPGHHRLVVGDEVGLRPGYAAMLRAATSPFVEIVLTGGALGPWPAGRVPAGAPRRRRRRPLRSDP